jgi:PHD/YefM family antitoxin component YafN of YafNO toxin-antitoxin module
MSKHKQRFLEPNVVTIDELTKNIDAHLVQVKDTGRPIVIIKNGKAAGVLVSTLNYNRMIYSSLFMESVAKGAADAAAGLILSRHDAEKEIKDSRAGRKKK